MDNNSVARVYQFLSQNYSNLNEWKQAVDEEGGNKDGIIEKHEVRNFLENSNFYDPKNDNIDDIVNRFWASIDVKTIGNVGLTSVSNKNALDNDELAKMELGLQASNKVSLFIQDNDTELRQLGLKNIDRCIESIKSGVLNKVLNHIKTKNISSIDSITNDVLEGFYKTVSKTAVADYAATDVIEDELVKLGFPKDDKEESYPIESDKTWKKIRDAYVNGFKNENDNTTLASIITGAKELAAAYADTAITNSQASVDKLGSTYNTHKLNDLQVAVLTKSIKEAVKNKLEEEFYELYGSEIDAKIPAFITKELQGEEASKFVTLKGQVDSLADKYINSEVSIIKTKYEELKIARRNLKTLVDNELSKPEDEHTQDRKDAASLVFGTSEINDIKDIIDSWDLEKVKNADANFRTRIAAIGGTDTKSEPETKEDPNQKIKSAFGDASKIEFTDFASMTLNYADVHTEFGINNGNIVFEQPEVTKIYENAKKELMKQIESKYKDAYDTIGAENIKKLIQTAWIMTYNDFNSSQMNNSVEFVKKVAEHLIEIFKKLSTSPEYLTVFTEHTAYADKDLVTDVPNLNIYTWDYEYTESNGEVTLDNSTYNNYYKETMSALLKNILSDSRYAEIDKNVLTSVFKKAQSQALKTCNDNKQDCPYGTTSSCQFKTLSDADFNAVGDKDWAGTGRHDDEWWIGSVALVEITLYYFDKLLYAELVK